MTKNNFLRHQSNFCRLLVLLLFTGAFSLPAFSILDPNTAVPRWELPVLTNSVSDAFVISYNVLDYGADNTGVKDNSTLFQKLLDKMRGTSASMGGVNGGGTLFLPAGKYRLDRSLIIPKGVTIRGEWKKPVKGEAIQGTIILTDYGRGQDLEVRALLIMEPSSGVKDLAFWYPQQDFNKIVMYPPTILYGKSGYFGNEYCIVKNVTLINSYNGVIFSRSNGGGAPNASGIYGSPLNRGIEIDNIAEVGRIEGVDFSPAYWIGSGLPGSPSEGDVSYKNWVRDNGTAITMRRNDWSYTSIVNVEGYNIGFRAVNSAVPTDLGATPNGQNYDMTFTNCRTGIYAEKISNVGIMFHKINIVDCEYGVFFSSGAGGTLQLSDANIDASKYAIGSASDASSRILVNQCTIQSGKVELLGGIFSLTDSDINTNAPQIAIGPDARGIISGNRFISEIGIVNKSMYQCEIDHTPLTEKKIPAFPYKDPETIKQKPTREVLYVATKAPYNAVNNATTDNTEAIQNALNQASADGGGIVFLPPGKYKVLGNLTIPTGVELKGAMDIGSVPTGPGSVLEVYAGKGDANATPFIKMSAGSGLRGIVINYPEQKYTEILSTTTVNPYVYPYCIQLTGNDIYIVNVGFRTTYNAIDIFTNKCDNFYIEYPAGHIFKTGIHVGSGSENGRINNAQFNTIAYACGMESKFGRWANSPAEGTDNMPTYRQNWQKMEFLILGECKNLMLFNDFHFGSNKGVTFANEGTGPSGISLGLGVDSSVKSLYFNALGTGGFDLIGSQIVTTTGAAEASGNSSAARYLETASTFTGEVTLFNADFWGQPNSAFSVSNGKVNMQLGQFDNIGTNRFSIGTNGRLSLFNSSVKPQGNLPINSGAEARFSAESSIIDAGSLVKANCIVYAHNLENSAKMDINSTIDRTGWVASAFNATGDAPRNSLDGNAGTRWSTSGAQAAGQWFMMDMLTPQTFNKVILDQGSSTPDYPRGYELYVSNDGSNWGSALVTGQGASGSATIIKLPETQSARYVKIIQTGTTTGNYWSIHEFYLANGETEEIEYPTLISDTKAKECTIYFWNGVLYMNGLSGISKVNVFNYSGQKLVSELSDMTQINVGLSSGMYIVTIENEGHLYRGKIMVK